jgi:hypothetical protein
MRRYLGLLTVLLCGCSSQPPPPEQAAAPPKEVKIVHFYAGSPQVERGQAGLLCYGVEGATSVRLDPPVEQLAPSPNRCIQVKPERETTYTLTAAGADGKTATQTVTVGVVAARTKPPAEGGPGRMISTFVAAATETAAGQPVTICYEVNGADSVKLEPSPQTAKPGKQCVGVTPQKTTTYTLSATRGGRTEVADLTIRVK